MPGRRMSDQIKTCSQCARTLPETAFVLNGGRRRSNCRDCQREKQQTAYAHKSEEWRLFDRARQRAKKKGVHFDLDVHDIKIPERCPVLGIKLYRNKNGMPADHSPSLDRVLGQVGYTRDNIRVISNKANRIKNDATVEELEAVLNFLKHDTCHF
jgi:hypothetical protein